MKIGLMSDIQIIDQLNTKLRRPLKQVENLTWFLKGYIVNSEGCVTHLNIFKSNFRGVFPEEIFKLEHLEHLDIRENNLEIIPKEIGNLANLKFLDLRNNQIRNLPVEFSSLNNLKKFYLGQNSFEKIPSQIGVLKDLTLVDLSENQISNGFEILITSKTLKNVYLNSNQIQKFPFDKLNNNQWDELVLLDNPLNDKPNSLFGKVKKFIV